MLTKIKIKNLKTLEEVSIPLASSIVFAGPNNSGKTTALQALSIWSFALDYWLQKRGPKPKAKQRTGVLLPITVLSALPVREAKLLWNNLATQDANSKKIKIEITVSGEEDGETWECGMELEYNSPEAIYCKPKGFEIKDFEIPEPAKRCSITHVPPVAGLRTHEEWRDIGAQKGVIGEGRPAEILRARLLEIRETNPEGWEGLRQHIADIFHVTLIDPVYVRGTSRYIISEFLTTPPHTKKAGVKLDIASGGSGFHQVLLLLAFMYSKKGAVLLLDEPDAHLHVILQREIYDLLRRVANEQGAQLIISTHSEIILDGTDATAIISFIAGDAHQLINTSQKSQLRNALILVRSIDFLQAKQIGRVLYVEGETDLKILREWARILNHPAHEFFTNPFFYPIGNQPNDAVEHFHALRQASPQLRGFCLLDRLEAQPPANPNLPIRTWKRREIENYLLTPSCLERFLQRETTLFSGNWTKALKYLKSNLPPEAFANPFGENRLLMNSKVSEDFLEPMFMGAGYSVPKKDFYLIATLMTPDEIHPEVAEKLDLIAEAFGIKKEL